MASSLSPTPTTLIIGVVASALCVGGCLDTTAISRVLSGDLRPLSPTSRARVPDPSSGESFNIERGTEGGSSWAHANAVIEDTAAAICARLEAPNVVNTPAVSSHGSTPTDDGWIITNHIRRAIVRFEFDITWRVRQLPEARGCAARWELSRGPEFLRDNRGWLRVSELDTRLAMLELQHELNAPRVTPDKAAAYVSLLHERLAGLTTP